MSLEKLAEISRRYGSDPEWVLAGGGNTSFKSPDTLHVKASGFPLATIGPEGFAAMDRAALQRIWGVTYPQESEAREAAALADLMAARKQGEEKRPSVETLMHELFPYAYVIHMHPALVNGLTCSQDGEAGARRLFGSRVLWVPAIEPGYVLAVSLRRMAQRYATEHDGYPHIVLLQNHGLVIAADTPEEIDTLHEEVRHRVQRALVRRPDFSPLSGEANGAEANGAEAGGAAPFDETACDRWIAAVATAYEEDVTVVFETNAEIAARVASEEAFAPLAGAFTPDHIVYAGSEPLYVEGSPVNAAAGLRSRLVSYRSEHGSLPRIIAVGGAGVLAVAEHEQACRTALQLFLDEVKIAAYAESFGGARHLDPHLVAFIEGWEVERYRQKISGGEKK